MRRTRQRIGGRVAVVTGGARGIGRATAEALLRSGGSVVICDVDELAARATAERLAQIGPVRALGLDVTDPEAFADVVGRVEEDVGPIGILVNNAGIMPLGAFLDQPLAADVRQVDVNVFGVIHGMRAVLPRMRARGEGHVVNVASVAGRIGTPHAAVYSATKHAVVGLTEAVRQEHRDSGVHFSYVLPALVDTELISGAGRPRFPPPVGPEQVAAAIVDAIQRRRVDVYVPRFTRIAHVLPAILPRPVYERVGEAFGLAEMFARIDRAARAEYDRRILHAPGPEKRKGTS